MIGLLEFCAGTILFFMWFATLSLADEGFGCPNHAATAPLTLEKIILSGESFVARALLTLAAAYVPVRLMFTVPWLLAPYVTGSIIFRVVSHCVDLRACFQDAGAYLADLWETASEVQVVFPDHTRYPGTRVDRQLAIGSSHPPIHHVDGFKWTRRAANRPSRADIEPQVEGNVQDEEVETCSICLSDFRRGNLVVVLPCGHVFHRRCISDWLDISLTCVNCRRQFEWALATKSKPAGNARRQKA